MSALNPGGPSQPKLNEVYQTEGNPATKEPAERYAAGANANAPSVGDHRSASQQPTGYQDATPSALGLGVHGAPPGEETKGYTQADVGKEQEFEGAQMRASGEKDVYNVVENKPGATGVQADLASDLDRKKAEQAPLREAIDKEKSEKVDVAGVLGQRPGPANPVDHNNYPNTGGN